MSQRPRGKIWKSDQKVVTDEKINPKILMDEKSWKNWKSNQKIVMNEELVQNGVMNEEFVQNGVMNDARNAKIDPKVPYDGSVHIQNWWMEQSATHQSKIVGRIY